MLIFRSKANKQGSTPISEFVRNASSREKKRVYKAVLEKATEEQKHLTQAARRARACA